MANILNTTILTEGTQKAVLHFYLESDGNEGELVNAPLFASVNFNTPLPRQVYAQTDETTNFNTLRPPQMTILQMWSSTSWFDFTISFQGTVNVPTLVVARDADFYMDFRYFGGLKDRVNDTPTGQMLISTKDFAPQGSNGFIVLEVRKN